MQFHTDSSEIPYVTLQILMEYLSNYSTESCKTLRRLAALGLPAGVSMRAADPAASDKIPQDVQGVSIQIPVRFLSRYQLSLYRLQNNSIQIPYRSCEIPTVTLQIHIEYLSSYSTDYRDVLSSLRHLSLIEYPLSAAGHTIKRCGAEGVEQSRRCSKL